MVAKSYDVSVNQGENGLPRPTSFSPAASGWVLNYLGGAAPKPPEFTRQEGKLKMSDLLLRVGESFCSHRQTSVAIPSGYPSTSRSPALPASGSPDIFIIAQFSICRKKSISLVLLRYKGKIERNIWAVGTKRLSHCLGNCHCRRPVVSRLFI